MLGLYVHLPFCPYVCPYCDFAKWPHKRSAADEYLRALKAEIERTPSAPADTIFFGGGTPNQYDSLVIAGLTQRLRERFASPGDFCEIAIEVNPELVGAADMQAYRDAGIDRVSIGVQSFVSSEIATLGRRHTVEQVADVVRKARDAGIRSVSLDLMFGVPGQTRASWARSLECAIELKTDHISAYGLTVEDGTPYAAWQARDPDAFAGEDLEADLYGAAIDALAHAGFAQYEISNFAKPGHESAHNANYWANGDYIGFGVGAASYRGGVRSTHTRALQAYVAAALGGEPIPGESERLEGPRRAGEAVMLALRTSQGVCLAAFKERYEIDFMQFYAPVIAEFRDARLLDIDKSRVRLTRRGRFVANDVCGAFVTFA